MKTFKPRLSLVCILEIALNGFGDTGPTGSQTHADILRPVATRIHSKDGSLHLNCHYASACLFDPRQNPIEFTIVYLHP
jgi:hypothetical protein